MSQHFVELTSCFVLWGSGETTQLISDVKSQRFKGGLPKLLI